MYVHTYIHVDRRAGGKDNGRKFDQKIYYDTYIKGNATRAYPDEERTRAGVLYL